MPADYYVPTRLDEARALMRAHDLDIVAGGTDFFPALGRDPVKRDILDVTRMPELHGLSWQEDGTLRIGAATTWSEIVNADLPPGFAGLQAAAREVGSLQIQNAGTVAGNICNASPAADGVPPLLTLAAIVEIYGPGGNRRLPLADFLIGVRRTALDAREFVSAIYVPPMPTASTSAFEKLGSRKYLVISIAMTAVVLSRDAAGKITFARVAVGSCSAVAQRLTGLERDLIGLRPEDVDVTPEHLTPLAPISDVRADATYRHEAVATQVKRVLTKAVRDG